MSWAVHLVWMDGKRADYKAGEVLAKDGYLVLREHSEEGPWDRDRCFPLVNIREWLVERA